MNQPDNDRGTSERARTGRWSQTRRAARVNVPLSEAEHAALVNHTRTSGFAKAVIVRDALRAFLSSFPREVDR